MSDDVRIENVSDTALWVANYRALESERHDSLFKDPLAARLVGERGRQIAASMPYGRIMYWIMVMRTLGIDELILEAVRQGVDTVINLGAGLDTRPYRMDLPPELKWIEVDFPHMIDLKNEKLKGEKSKCHLERIACDLSKIPDRRELFAKMGHETSKALVITEGVIPYLTNEEAGQLADDLKAVPTFALWIQDFRVGGFAQKMPRKYTERLKASPFRFTERDWFGFFARHGWVKGKVLLTLDIAERVKRPFPLSFLYRIIGLFFGAKRIKEFRQASGYVTLERG